MPVLPLELNNFITQSGFNVKEHIDIGEDVYKPLHQYIKQHNKNVISSKVQTTKEQLKVARYWELVLNNYASLNQKNMMGYQIYKLQK